MRCYKCPFYVRNPTILYEISSGDPECTIRICEISYDKNGDEGCKYTLSQLKKIKDKMYSEDLIPEQPTTDKSTADGEG